MQRAAERLVQHGARAVLIKGGHLDADEIVDLFYDGSEYVLFRKQKRLTENTHGTGCTLTAAIAAGLAFDRPLKEAVSDALAFVDRAIAGAPGLRSGHGPLNHFVSVRE